MSQKVYKNRPSLKVGEWPIDQGGKAYIYFEEFLNIPGLEKANIRIEFERDNSFQEVCALVEILKNSGFTFVVQK